MCIFVNNFYSSSYLCLLTYRLRHIPRPKMSVCVLGDAQHMDEAKANDLPCMDADALKKLNKNKKLVKKLGRFSLHFFLIYLILNWWWKWLEYWSWWNILFPLRSPERSVEYLVRLLFLMTILIYSSLLSAKKYRAFVASDSLIKLIPRILGPGLNKAGKFPTMVTHNESLVAKVNEVKTTVKFQMKKVNKIVSCTYFLIGIMKNIICRAYVYDTALSFV